MPLNVLIVSTQIFCERLTVSMKAPIDKLYNGDVIVKVTDSAEYLRPMRAVVESTLQDIEKKTVDYVFIVLDGCQMKNTARYQRVLENLMPHYTATRVALVNGTCRSAPNAVVVAREMTDLADEYNIPFLNAEIMDDESCRRTAEKLLRMASVASGYHTGIPIPIPTVADLGLKGTT